jgi:hypothetical protein
LTELGCVRDQPQQIEINFMKREAPATAQEVHETLYDGADIVVTYQSAPSHPSSIKVRKIPREEFSHLALLIQDESEEAEYREAALYCGKDEAWARTLSEESLDRVLAEGQRLNFPSFARWFRRRARLPGLVAGQQMLVQAALEAMTQMESHGRTNGSVVSDATAMATSGGSAPTK